MLSETCAAGGWFGRVERRERRQRLPTAAAPHALASTAMPKLGCSERPDVLPKLNNERLLPDLGEPPPPPNSPPPQQSPPPPNPPTTRGAPVTGCATSTAHASASCPPLSRRLSSDATAAAAAFSTKPGRRPLPPVLPKLRRLAKPCPPSGARDGCTGVIGWALLPEKLPLLGLDDPLPPAPQFGMPWNMMRRPFSCRGGVLSPVVRNW
mmetsp:Transcript_12044/g.35497  ORF Transcript_12044/g.35497 Transcript_12044/m.35497 type:complete len:209 (+) Transcript_12044:55-681(+)|eukprot:292985-Chlamydomonas_euryale.AAC.6